MRSALHLTVAMVVLIAVPRAVAQPGTASLPRLPASQPLVLFPRGPAHGDSLVFAADSSLSARPVPAGQSKSPGLAMGLSAILPGAGQAYNESYWKIPIIAGFGGYFIYEFVQNNKLYLDYRDQYRQSLETTPGGDPRLLDLREFYKDQRDTFGFYFVILYAVNILDAYVDASLHDFDISDDLSLRLMPGGGAGPVTAGGITLQLRFSSSLTALRAP